MIPLATAKTPCHEKAGTLIFLRVSQTFYIYI